MELNSAARTNLRKGAVWARFLAIACFVILGLSTLGIVFTGVMFNNLGNHWIAPVGNDLFGLVSTAYMIFMSVVIVLCAVPTVFLLCFSSKAKKAVDLGDEAVLEQSMGALRRYFTLSGVVTLACLLMSVLGALTSFFWFTTVGLANM